VATQQMIPEFASQPPFATKEERMTTAALQAAVAPSSVVRGMLTRPLFMDVQAHEAITVEQCLNLSRATNYNTNYTGGSWDINASARNSGYSTI
jgi:hypothetical protein